MSNIQKEIVSIWDIDKTILPGYSIIDFASFLYKSGQFDQAAYAEINRAIECYKSNDTAIKITYNQFADLVVLAYGQGIAGKSIETIKSFSRAFWTARLETIYPYVLKVFEILHQFGAQIIAVSGSSLDSLSPLLDHLGFDATYTTEVDSTDGVYGENVKVNAASELQKEQIVSAIFASLAPDAIVFGFGDSIADSTFLKLATHAVVVGTHDPDLQALALDNGWLQIPDPLVDDDHFLNNLLLKLSA